MKHIRTFESFLNETVGNVVIFSVDDDTLDNMLNSRFSSQLDYQDIKGDSFYSLPKRDFDRFIDMADSAGFDVDYENSEDSVVFVQESAITESAVNEAYENVENYMFFGNLETLKRKVEILLSGDFSKMDKILKNGHDWAEDHIAVATENVSQVADFFMNELKEEGSGVTPGNIKAANENASSEAVYINVVTGNGQTAIQDFIDENGIDVKKLVDYAKEVKGTADQYKLRDMISGTGLGSNEKMRNNFIKKMQ